MKEGRAFRGRARIGFLAVLSAAGMTCSRSVEPYYTGGVGLEGRHPLVKLLGMCIRSLSSDMSVQLLAAVFVYILLRLVRRRGFPLRDRVTAGIFALFFSAVQLTCQSFSEYGSWISLFGSRFVFCRAMLIIIGTALPVYCLILLAWGLLDQISGSEAGVGTAFCRKKYILASLLVFLCWMPYFICFCPGTSGNDTATQIAQFFGQDTWTREMSAVRGKDIYLSNHFPYFTTLLMGGAVRLGIWLGDSAIGVALYSLVQMLVMAFALTGVWFYLCRAGLSERCLKAGLLFTAFFPSYPMYAICMMKDPMFGLLGLLLAVFLYEAVRTKGEAFRSRKFCAALSADCLLLMLFRSQGVYILAVIVIAALAAWRRYWRRVALSMLLPLILFQGVWIHVLLPAWNVAPGGRQEALGVFFQQTARYVSLYPQDVTEEERRAVGQVLDYENLAENYSPKLADGVKFTFNQDCTSGELREYFKAWLSMFLKHPGVYAEAVINNCSDYFYLPYTGDLYCVSFKNRSGWKEDGDLFVHMTFDNSGVRSFFEVLVRLAQRIPVINLLFSIGAYSWVVAYFFFCMIRKKKYMLLIPGLAAILSVGILLIGPANGRFRYIIPLFYQVPFLLGACLLQGGEKRKGQ